MTRRTRRDLSNPKIKRIVKKQILSSRSQIAFAVDSPFNLLFKRVFLFIVAVFILVWGYSLLQTSGAFTLGSLFESMTSTENLLDKSESEPAAEAGNESSEASAEEKVIIEPVARKLQVEVLNGCGAGGIAAKVTKYLRDNDIDVVNVGNHSRFDIKQTVLWKRIDENQPSQKIAELLGLSENRIEEKIDPNLQLHVTIILGADYNTLIPFKN